MNKNTDRLIEEAIAAVEQNSNMLTGSSASQLIVWATSVVENAAIQQTPFMLWTLNLAALFLMGKVIYGRLLPKVKTPFLKERKRRRLPDAISRTIVFVSSIDCQYWVAVSAYCL